MLDYHKSQIEQLAWTFRQQRIYPAGDLYCSVYVCDVDSTSTPKSSKYALKVCVQEMGLINWNWSIILTLMA